MARVVFTPTAREHLRRIRAYIARDSRAAADAMARRIRRDAGRLARHPQMGRVVPEYEDPSIRELIVASYRVIYRFDADANLVSVVGIIHGSRLLP
jgi:plasmid stabilization system protein ParE